MKTDPTPYTMRNVHRMKTLADTAGDPRMAQVWNNKAEAARRGLESLRHLPLIKSRDDTRKWPVGYTIIAVVLIALGFWMLVAQAIAH